MAILQDLSKEELIARLIAAQNASQGRVVCKVAKAGGMSVYGMGRFPVTLYASQWDKLLANVDHIRAELDRLRPHLATKD